MNCKRSLFSFYLIVLILSGFLFSCGTIHHTIPPKPLGLHERRIDFVLSSDLHLLDIVPNFAVNFYWGVGKNTNIGIGYSPPAGISHVSIAKYLDTDGPYSNSIFASLNGVLLSTNTHNTKLDLGISAHKKYQDKYHTISIGYWFFLNHKYPVIFQSITDDWIANDEPEIYKNPFFKYQHWRKYFGITVQNYCGLTSAFSQALCKKKQSDGRKIVIKNAEIDSSNFHEKRSDLYLLIYLKDGSGYELNNDLGIDADDRFHGSEMTGVNRYVPITYVRKMSRNYNRENYYGGYALDINQIYEDIKSGKDIVLEYDPARIAKHTQKLKWHEYDWSIGGFWRDDSD